MARTDFDDEPVSVASVAAEGDIRRTLEALRDSLARQLDACEPAVAAQISGQLRQVLKDLQALPAPKGGSKRDEVKQKREARRRAAPSVVADASSGGRERG